MKRLLLIFIATILMISCNPLCYTYYYNYMEVSSPESATEFSLTLAERSQQIYVPTGKYTGYYVKESPTRCIGVYTNADGNPVYVMETKMVKQDATSQKYSEIEIETENQKIIIPRPVRPKKTDFKTIEEYNTALKQYREDYRKYQEQFAW